MLTQTLDRPFALLSSNYVKAFNKTLGEIPLPYNEIPLHMAGFGSPVSNKTQQMTFPFILFLRLGYDFIVYVFFKDSASI